MAFCSGLDDPVSGGMRLRWRGLECKVGLTRGVYGVLVPLPVFERYYDARTGEFGGTYALYPHEFVLRPIMGRGFLYETDDAAKVAGLLACFVAITNAEDASRVAELDAAERQAAQASRRRARDDEYVDDGSPLFMARKGFCFYQAPLALWALALGWAGIQAKPRQAKPRARRMPAALI